MYSICIIVYTYVYAGFYPGSLGGSYKPTNHNYSTITRVHKGEAGGKLKNLGGIGRKREKERGERYII